MRWEVNIYRFELLACLGRINCTNIGAQWSTQSTKIVSSIRNKVKSDTQGFGWVIRGVIHTFVPFILALATTLSTIQPKDVGELLCVWHFIFRECFAYNHSVKRHSRAAPLRTVLSLGAELPKLPLGSLFCRHCWADLPEWSKPPLGSGGVICTA